MRQEDPGPESAPADAGAQPVSASWPQRLAALLALIALLAAAAVSSWWILTDQADFRAAAARRAPSAGSEAPAKP